MVFNKLCVQVLGSIRCPYRNHMNFCNSTSNTPKMHLKFKIWAVTKPNIYIFSTKKLP